MKKTIIKILSCVVVCCIMIFSMCSFMSYDRTDGIVSDDYTFMAPHLSPAVTVSTKATLNGTDHVYYHTVPDVFGITVDSDISNPLNMSYKNSKLDCGLSYLQVGSTLYDDVKYKLCQYTYGDGNDAEVIQYVAAEQVLLFEITDFEDVTFTIEDQWLRSELIDLDWFEFLLKPLKRDPVTNKYVPMTENDYSIELDYIVHVGGMVAGNLTDVYFSGSHYDIVDMLCSEIETLNGWDLSDYKYVYVEQLKLTYNFFGYGDAEPCGFSYRSVISDNLIDQWDLLCYNAQFTTPYLNLSKSLSESIDKYNALAEGVQNERALPLLFDGIYKTIHNTLMIFFNMDFFGVKLGTVVSILLGAAVVILILKVVL